MSLENMKRWSPTDGQTVFLSAKLLFSFSGICQFAMTTPASAAAAAELRLLLDLEQLEGEMERMIDHQELAELCQLQLTELEMLAAMFPQAGELKVIDPAAVAEMTEFVEGSLHEPPARLDYTIAFQTEQVQRDP